MNGLLSVIIVAAAFFLFISKSLKNSASDTARSKTAPPAKKYSNYRPHKDIVSVSRDMGDRKGAVLRDDRNNDWLAQQLRDEHRAFKATSEMFDLKIEHASHCDARLLEQFYKRNHATGVDLANGSTARRAHN